MQRLPKKGRRAADSARDQTAHQAAAKVHEDTAESMYARGDSTGAVKERQLARADRESAGISAERAQLSRERQRDNANEDAPSVPASDDPLGDVAVAG